MSFSHVAAYTAALSCLACVAMLYGMSKWDRRKALRERTAWARDHGQFADWKRTGVPQR